jgi:hypothetical protein
MKEISSYEQLVKKRKSIQIQRELLENEIFYLHESPSSESSGILNWLSHIHPRDLMKAWDVGVFLIRKFRASEKEKSENSK